MCYTDGTPSTEKYSCCHSFLVMLDTTISQFWVNPGRLKIARTFNAYNSTVFTTSQMFERNVEIAHFKIIGTPNLTIMFELICNTES